MASLNDTFLAACRALLTPSQHEAWDDCAAQLDLFPQRGRGPGGRRGPNAQLGPQEGDPAPGFVLTDLDGKTVTLESLRGKPVMLEFGSYTCPVFRRMVNQVEQLRRDFGNAVHWVMIYTREAHPTDGWVARGNTGPGIEIPQHTSFDKRLECAALCKQKLELNLLVLVDTIDDKATNAYAGAPNRGFVIDAEGKIVSRQVWFDAERTRRALEKLLEEKRTATRREQATVASDPPPNPGSPDEPDE